MANLIRKRHASPSSVWRDADLTRLFEDLFTPTSTASFVPSLELSETDNEYMISVELPGMGEDDIDVQVDDNNVLTIRGEKKSEVRETRGGSEFSERSYGEFVRSIQLPPSIQAERVEATYENGVLELSVPKAAETRARKIPIGKEEKSDPKVMSINAPVEAAEAPKEDAPASAQESASDGHQAQPQHH